MENKEVYLNEGDNDMISTPQELMNSTIQKVEDILKNKYDDYLAFGNGTFTISRGEIQVMIIVRPFTENDTVIECMANVVSGSEISNELMQFLLRKNAELHFGAFGLLFDNTVVFQHSIAGTNVDGNELANSVNAVAIIADHYANEIITLAGGNLPSDQENEIEN